MNYKRNKSGLLKRVPSLLKFANDLNLKLDWERTGNDYEMRITDGATNKIVIQEIKGFKSKTEALHSGFDYFEKVFWEKKEEIGN